MASAVVNCNLQLYCLWCFWLLVLLYHRTVLWIKINYFPFNIPWEGNMKGCFVFIFSALHTHWKRFCSFPIKISLYVSKFRVVTKMLMSSVLENSYEVQFFEFHSLNLLDSGTLWTVLMEDFDISVLWNVYLRFIRTWLHISFIIAEKYHYFCSM